MTMPLILQIQEAALDGRSSLSDALRKAKLACAKLGLSEFGRWVDQELDGYMEMTIGDLPKYRILRGTPEAFNPYRGWLPITFETENAHENFSRAPVGMKISAIEDSLPKTEDARGYFSFPYPPVLQKHLRESLDWAEDLRIKLDRAHLIALLDAVRNILLNWTIEMEKQGILGENLTFSPADREKSAAVTAQTVNTISIANVGAFVQSADHSIVHGEVAAAVDLSRSVLNLARQVNALLPASDLPAPLQEQTRGALKELTDAAAAPQPDHNRLAKGLTTLKRVLAPAAESLVKIAVDAAVTKMLAPGG